jgi:hypothetical protein
MSSARLARWSDHGTVRDQSVYHQPSRNHGLETIASGLSRGVTGRDFSEMRHHDHSSVRSSRAQRSE